MKNLIALIFVATMGVMSSAAHAFITVIDVTEQSGGNTTITTPSDYSFTQLEGKALSYRGQASEAVSLFTKLADGGLPKGLYEIESEINEATGTVSITIRTQGFAGWDYRYWILKRAGE